MLRRASYVVLCALSIVVLAENSGAVTYHFEGFEDASSPTIPSWTGYVGGDITRVSSGHDGITSSEGSAHAIIHDLQVRNDVFGRPSLGAGGPYTQFGGYSSEFGGGFSASLDVYLDPTRWYNGRGFDYSVAVSRQSGDHLRDFTFHVGMVGDSLLLNASNNSDLNYNEYKLLNENSGDYGTVSDAGWYTLEHSFFDNGGTLSATFSVYDDIGGLVYNVTRDTSDDIASVVGGNRYGWMTYNNIEGLAIDNTKLTPASSVPDGGATFVLMALSLFAGAALRKTAVL